jgi:hypothetical protein
MSTVKQISDNGIYLLIKYIKSVFWRVAVRLSYIEDARCLKVKQERFVSILETLKTSRYQIYEVINELLSVNFRRPRTIATVMMSNEGIGKMPNTAGNGNRGYGRYIPTRIRACSRVLRTVVVQATFIGNRLLHSGKGIMGYDKHN